MAKIKFLPILFMTVLSAIWSAFAYSEQTCEKVFAGNITTYSGYASCTAYTYCGSYSTSSYFSGSFDPYPTMWVSTWCNGGYTTCRSMFPLTFTTTTPVYKTVCTTIPPRQPVNVIFSGTCSGSSCEGPSRNCSSQGGSIYLIGDNYYCERSPSYSSSSVSSATVSSIISSSSSSTRAGSGAVLFSGYCYSGSECEGPSRNCSSQGGRFTLSGYQYTCTAL